MWDQKNHRFIHNRNRRPFLLNKNAFDAGVIPIFPPSTAAMKEKKESKKKKEGNKLPDHIELQRTHVVCGTERNHHVSRVTLTCIMMKQYRTGNRMCIFPYVLLLY